MLAFEDFQQVDLRVARVEHAERVPNSSKLLRLALNLGGGEERQVIAGIGTMYEPEGLLGREVAVVANLEPRQIMGFESQGMILAADDGRPIILVPERPVAPGSKIT